MLVSESIAGVFKTVSKPKTMRRHARFVSQLAACLIQDDRSIQRAFSATSLIASLCSFWMRLKVSSDWLVALMIALRRSQRGSSDPGETLKSKYTFEKFDSLGVGFRSRRQVDRADGPHARFTGPVSPDRNVEGPGVEARSGRFNATRRAEDVISRETAVSRLIENLLSLDKPFLSVVLWRYYHRLTLRQISQRIGMPVWLVERRIDVALDLLRSKLDKAYRGGGGTWRQVLMPLLPDR